MNWNSDSKLMKQCCSLVGFIRLASHLVRLSEQSRVCRCFLVVLNFDRQWASLTGCSCTDSFTVSY